MSFPMISFSKISSPGIGGSPTADGRRPTSMSLAKRATRNAADEDSFRVADRSHSLDFCFRPARRIEVSSVVDFGNQEFLDNNGFTWLHEE